MSKQQVTRTVLTGNTDHLTPEMLKELQEKFQLTVKIRGHEDVVDKMIGQISDAASYDRTHPGYDRSYDKSPGADLMDILKNRIINPEINVRNLDQPDAPGGNQ
ncbi:hypothetical protein [Dyadobacter sp. Leaf189]|uniref:hypothetical protein n=1 Tax=Dyadobacter sp. Leaf189 TaxID=1736295 RepID=UPI0007014C8F|nr:hypothetical protein [Dyadobacter sp. Leaf189]KQS27069.1 hypothetical protein ASG33_21285 [Dyadobacter sp. Leaf189]